MLCGTSDITAIEELRHRIATLEGRAGAGGHGVVALGLAGIDAMFTGGGLARGRFHEICFAEGPCHHAAAVAFTCVLLAALAQNDRPVLWARRQGLARTPVYAPGLAGFGVLPRDVVVADCRRAVDVMWALEEAARSPAVAAAVGENQGIDLTASRRLQLAAEVHGITLFQLGLEGRVAATAATTRWRISSLPSAVGLGEPGVGAPCWRVALLRNRGGQTGVWDVRWDGRALVAADQPIAPLVTAPLVTAPAQAWSRPVAADAA